ncbi:MAG: FtsQ-type POTRA domain-containing protein [Alphaproteobacteria bacterium]|nr:FtsQ-type POTRA domain-containing protein [Alphaproteobacteria bacterium]
MRSRGTRKSVYLRRRHSKIERLVYFARRFGRIAGVVVFLLWLGSWFVLSGGVQKAQAWGREESLRLSAQMGFAVDNILVEGRVHTDPEIIKGLVNMDKGDPVLAFDPVAVQIALEKVSWVRSARVERRLPDTIFIELVEREPLALWQSGGHLSLIDEDGEVLAETRLAAFEDLVILVGAGAPAHAAKLLGLLNAEPALKDKVEYASWIGDRRWDLKLESGIDVSLPETEEGLALRRLMAMHEQDGLLDKDIVAVDLRTVDRIIVRPRRGEAQAWQAGFEKGI